MSAAGSYRGVVTTARIRARDGGLLALVVAGLAAIALAAHAHQVATDVQLKSSVGTPRPPRVGQNPLSNGAGKSHTFHPHLHVPWWLLSAVGQLLLAALVVLIVVVVIKLVPGFQSAPRPAKQPTLPPTGSDGRRLDEQAGQTVRQALAGLRRGDREQAIIDCWLRLQDLVTRAGYRLADSETSSELVARWQSVLPFSRPALGELAELYREARFSSHRMSAESLQRATDALNRLHRDLQTVRPRHG
ncbi:MAG TPA: DUF4129 domain-containing protein [Jatrophihabitans sp.]|nr:DUF4129 domain-containing protein [Jatrophihabitans sp.]